MRAVASGRASTMLDDMSQAGAAKIRLPRLRSPQMLDMVMINTAGGLTGGDRFKWAIDAAANTYVRASTQACEKIYKAADGVVSVDVGLTAGDDARLEWIPQETILFDHSRLKRVITVNMAATANLLIVEPIIFGRRHFGELAPVVSLNDQWRIYVEGRLAHAEAMRIDETGPRWFAAQAGANNCAAFATVLFIGDEAETLAHEIERALQRQSAPGGAVYAASSFWKTAGTEKLVVRLAAEDGYHLRRRLTAIVAIASRTSAPPSMWLQ